MFGRPLLGLGFEPCQVRPADGAQTQELRGNSTQDECKGDVRCDVRRIGVIDRRD